MKIVLTHTYFLEEDPKEKLIMKPYVPLGILYISAYLEKAGYDNEVFDATFSSFEKQKAYLSEQQPDVVAIYTNLMTKIKVIQLVKWIKQNPQLRDTKLILGGPEVRHHAQSFLETGADVICVGEGEETMLEIIKCFDKQQIQLQAIKGICYLDDTRQLIKTAERNLIKNIDELPLPNRSKIDFKAYLNTWKTHHGYSMMSVSTMRGCPYTCKWCSRAVYGGTYRRRSPELVAEELLQIKNTYQPDMIWFVDDVFTIHHRWLASFAEEVKKRNAVIPYEIISRADRLNEDVLKILKDSGCYRIWIGAESGSQKIIDAMDRRVDVMETRQMIRLAQKYGIKAGTFIMLGYPGETKADIKATIQHLVESNPDLYTITIAYPIKGTPLYAEIEDKMLASYDFETNTDRDIDFKRLYPKKFYEKALKWLQIEVFRQTKNKQLWKAPYLKLKSIRYQLAMAYYQLKA